MVCLYRVRQPLLWNFLVLADIREFVSDLSELCVIARHSPYVPSVRSANAIGYRIPIPNEKIRLLRVCYAPANGIA